MIACRSNVSGRGSILFLSFLGVSALLFPLIIGAAGWIFVEACGFELPEDLDDFAGVRTVRAPNIKGYWIDVRAIAALVEFKGQMEGPDCSIVVLVGGRDMYVLGNAQEIRRKLEDAK